MTQRHRRGPGLLEFLIAAAVCLAPAVTAAQRVGTPASGDLPVTALPPAIRQGRELLSAGKFGEARALFAAYLQAHPQNGPAELGLGDAQAGLRQYEAAELTYRKAAAQEPQLWQAHKDLLPVEAALGRWDEFDRERQVLRAARERGAPGISARESDVVDRFDVSGRHWVVRTYFEPVGRSEARVNFECFSPGGRVLAYLSLENATAAEAALRPGDVRIGAKSAEGVANSTGSALALNWYTGTAHGSVRSYTGGEPPYRLLRRAAIAWLERHPEVGRAGPT